MVRVLIVEDSRVQAAQLEFILNARGFDTEVARNGIEALQAIRARLPDVVVSDVVMPGMSGYDLCRQIKADATDPPVPVMLVSSLSEPLETIRGLECGADNFLTKPYQEDHLIDRITTLLHNRQLRSERDENAGVDIVFLGQRLTVHSEREQILDFLISSFEDTVRANRDLQASRAELAAAHAKIEEYARRLEDKVRVSEEKYRLLMEGARDALVVLDSKGTIVEANLKLEEMIGRPRRELIGAACETVLTVPIDSGRAADLQALVNGRAATAKDLPLHRANAIPMWADVSASTVEISGEAFVLLIIHDVTERRSSEMQLRQLQKMDALGRLTGGIAHDFNNLLGVIIGNVDLLGERVVSDPELNEIAQAALGAALHGAEMTQRLLAFARKQPLLPRTIDLHTVLPGIATMLRRALDATIDVRLSIAENLWPTQADSSQVEDALLNLAINARDAMGGAGKLLIEASNVTFDDDYVAETFDVAPGEYVLLAVSDTGTGMPPEVIERALEPFFTTKPVGEGTGLGLSMVYGFVKQSGGHLSIYSEVGFGTTIKIYLPRAGISSEPRDVAPPDPAESRGRGERILVVEDNEKLRAVALRMLRELGYETREASNGAEALEMLTGGASFDLLFTDIVMPGGMTGRELAVSARRLRPKLKALLTTGYSEAVVASDDLVVGGIAVLRKPYRKAELAVTLRMVLEGRDAKMP